MSTKANGQLRRSQVITTWGPGSLLDLPQDAVIVAGLDTWGRLSELESITEPRLVQKLEAWTGVRNPGLYAPPPAPDHPGERRGIGAWRFPEWFLVQEGRVEERKQSRRLVHLSNIERGRFDGRPVVPTRFVRACPRGHVDDLDWFAYAHRGHTQCRRQLWLDERGTGGDLVELVVRCECGEERRLYEATVLEENPLGNCRGRRPWLGQHANETCGQPSRLLIRTASNAYFPQVVSVLSLPERGAPVKAAVSAAWDILQAVNEPRDLAAMRRIPQVADRLDGFSDEDVMRAIQEVRGGAGEGKSIKPVELEAILAAPEGFGDDVPVDPNFHARRLPGRAWRRSNLSDPIEAVIQLHRLREVLALAGFTRFESVTPDINGDYDTDVERAELALEPRWFPAVENRGEGVFVRLRSDLVRSWRDRREVKDRLDKLELGHRKWLESRSNRVQRDFPGGAYMLLHTLSHLLIQSMAMRCGYPASSIRERIYAVEGDAGGYGILLYTGTPDADGTLGGLVQQARHMESHLAYALRTGSLCSNDPICAQHDPGVSMEARWLHGAACHGCALIAETSCEMRNDYLDRALVVPTLGLNGVAFFGAG